MYPRTRLECWHDGEWRRIGWVVSSPKAVADLREHGDRLAAHGGHYRLVQDSIYADGPSVVVRIWSAVPA